MFLAWFLRQPTIMSARSTLDQTMRVYNQSCVLIILFQLKHSRGYSRVHGGAPLLITRTLHYYITDWCNAGHSSSSTNRFFYDWQPNSDDSEPFCMMCFVCAPTRLAFHQSSQRRSVDTSPDEATVVVRSNGSIFSRPWFVFPKRTSEFPIVCSALLAEE
jgi:hypothetical protein